MTPLSKVRARSRALGGAALIAAMITAGAPPAANAAGARSAGPELALSDPTPTYRQAFTVRGHTAARYAGGLATLEFGAPGEGWQPVGTARVATGGSYSFSVALARSGALRAVVRAHPSAAQAAAADEQVGAARRVAVGAQMVVTRRHLEVFAGGTASVSGFIRPAGAGRPIRLERRVSGAWRVIASARTGAGGSYRLGYRVGRTALVRLSLAGDAVNAPSVRSLGRIGAFRATTASRYDMYGGALACGGRLGYDSLVVAHRSLPCGTPVTIRYRGRTVHARVQDRGPFVGGREFDLAGAVARRLGFDGVGRVWVSV